MRISDITQGLIDVASDISHDPEDQDFFDLDEYLEIIPNSTRVLKELIYYMHQEYL